MSYMDKSTICIRRASYGDLEALEAARTASIQAEEGWPQRFSFELAEHMETEGTFTYLIEDECPFGFVTVGRCELDLAEGEIFEWFLRKKYQQSTYGRRLLIHGLSVLKRRQCESALIWLPAPARRAKELLQRQAFEDSGAIRERNAAQVTTLETGLVRDLSDFF